MAFSRAGIRLGGITAVAAGGYLTSLYQKPEPEALPTSADVSFAAPMDLACRHDRAAHFVAVPSRYFSLPSRTFSAASATATQPIPQLSPNAAAPAEPSGKPGGKKARRLKKRERRFQAFASCEFEGQLFMTAQDFLESVTKEEPRGRSSTRSRRCALTMQNLCRSFPL